MALAAHVLFRGRVVEMVAARRVQVLLALAAVYLIWGSTYYGIVVALRGFPPLLLAGLRHLSAGILMYAVLRARGASAPDARQWRDCILLGVLFQALGNGLVVMGSHWVDSSLAAVLVASMPLWAAVFGAFWGQWPTRREGTGLLLGTLGVVVLNLGGSAGGRVLGVVVVLMAAASWALGTVWSRHLKLPGGFMTSAAQMIGGGLVLLVGAVVRGERMEMVPGGDALLAWIYLTIFGSIVGYTAFQFLLRNVSRTLATSYAYVNPLVAMAIGVGIGGEPLTVPRAAGTAFILGGVMLIALRPTSASPAVGTAAQTGAQNPGR